MICKNRKILKLKINNKLFFLKFFKNIKMNIIIHFTPMPHPHHHLNLRLLLLLHKLTLPHLLLLHSDFNIVNIFYITPK